MLLPVMNTAVDIGKYSPINACAALMLFALHTSHALCGMFYAYICFKGVFYRRFIMQLYNKYLWRKKGGNYFPF